MTNRKEVPFYNKRFGVTIMPGERVLFLASSSHTTDYLLGTYLGCIERVNTPRGTSIMIPQVRYKATCWEWNEGTQTGKYVPCEKIATLTLGRVINHSIFQPSHVQ
jgi:hypothetical protein